MPRKVPKLEPQEIKRGDDWFLPLKMKVRTGPNTWEPMDLTEWTFSAAWTPYYDSPEVIMLSVTKTLPNEILVHATKEQTIQICEWNEGVFDLQGVRPGETKTFLEAPTYRSPDVTP